MLYLWYFLTGLLIFSTTAGFLGKYHCFLNLFSHFRQQYFYLSLLLFISLIYIGPLPYLALLAAALFICIMLNGEQIFYYYLGRYNFIDEDLQLPTLKVFFSNIYKNNHQFDRVLSQIEELKANFVAIVEFTPEHKIGLESLNKNYNYSYEHCREDGFGMAFYSQYPFELVHQSRQFDIPFLIFRVQHSAKAFHLAIFHPPPPLFADWARIFEVQIQELTDLIHGKDAIVVGDFNASPWCYHFQQFLKKTRLQDPREIFGINFSWMKHSPLALPIDHILASDTFQFADFQVLPSNGSDHRSVLAEILIK